MSASGGILASLEQRPVATAYQVDTLLADAAAGRLRVPFFQRGLRWQDKHRLELFDSIYRGYPIGSLLLWEREGPLETVGFDGVNITAAAGMARFIVDGQQRVTTLVSTLYREPSAGERAIVFDLAERRFAFRKISAQRAPEDSRWVPVATLFDARRLVRWLRQETMDEEIEGIAIDAGKRLREYQVPAYVVQTDNVDVLRRIFERVNRANVRLNDAEVFNALFGDEHRKADLRSVAENLLGLNYGMVTETTVLKTLRAIEGLPLDGDLPTSVEQRQMQSAIQKATEALVRVVDFLRNVAMVPRLELLPYELPLVVLGRFFHLHPDPTTRSLMLLRRWLWRGAIAGDFTGAIVGLRRNVFAVDGGEEESVQRLLGLIDSRIEHREWARDAFNLRTARTCLELCALASLEPYDLVTNLKVDLPREIERGGGSIPVATIITEGADDLRGAVANKMLHPRASSKALREAIIQNRASADGLELLSRHVISGEAVDALGAGDEPGFLLARSAGLTSFLDAFFRRQAEWDSDDSPTLQSMVVAE